MTSSSDLDSATLAVVEEREPPATQAKLKEFFASQLQIRKLRPLSDNPPNTAHRIQCASYRSAMPVFPGDIRVVELDATS